MSAVVGIAGIGVLGPGLDGWEAARALLAADTPFAIAQMRNPAPAILPSAERRRASVAIRLALEVAQQAVTHAGRDAAGLGCIFTSCDGDGDTIHAVCTALTEPDYPVSPTRFSNSVHNAPAGYWSIAAHVREPSTSLCGFEQSFAVGLIEAATQVAVDAREVLLVASDVPLPPPLAALHPTHHAFGAGLVLTPAGAAAPLGTLHIDLAPERAPTVWPAAVPEALRRNPSAQVLPLLAAIARGRAARLSVDYGPSGALRVEYRP